MVGKRAMNRKFNRIMCGGWAQGDVWDMFLAVCGAIASQSAPAPDLPPFLAGEYFDRVRNRSIFDAIEPRLHQPV